MEKRVRVRETEAFRVWHVEKAGTDGAPLIWAGKFRHTSQVSKRPPDGLPDPRGGGWHLGALNQNPGRPAPRLGLFQSPARGKVW